MVSVTGLVIKSSTLVLVARRMRDYANIRRTQNALLRLTSESLIYDVRGRQRAFSARAYALGPYIRSIEQGTIGPVRAIFVNALDHAYFMNS